MDRVSAGLTIFTTLLPYLLELLEEVGEGPRNDASVRVLLHTTCDRECLTRPSLSWREG